MDRPLLLDKIKLVITAIGSGEPLHEFKFSTRQCSSNEASCTSHKIDIMF